MTLKEIQRQIDIAAAAPIKEDGTSDYYNLLPCVYYKDLPAKLKKEADKITPETAKRFLFECYPVGTLEKLAEDKASFEKKIKEALHAAKYLIESTDLTPPKPTGNASIDAANLEAFSPVSLMGADFIAAWEKVTGFAPIAAPKIQTHRLTKIDFPLDKVNSNVWRLLEDTKGQLSLKIDVSKRGSKKPIDVLYSLDFSSLENVSITRKLEPYDKRVYLAIAAIFNDGYDVMSIQQIYNAMGYKGRAGASDIKKINAAITKMSGARLYIDNLAEHTVYEYDHFKYDGVLLPMERMQAIINGQTAEAAIHIFREPPMVSFARERKQITTIDIKLLDTPLSKTNANIEIEDYLIEAISKIKSGSRNAKILFSTIYENANITSIKQRQRAPEKIKQLLDHYIECGYIKGYAPKELADLKRADGIKIQL